MKAGGTTSVTFAPGTSVSTLKAAVDRKGLLDHAGTYTGSFNLTYTSF